MFKNQKDLHNYSVSMQTFLFVDIFWWTFGRLGSRVHILNDSGNFRSFLKKRWKKQPSIRWDQLQVQQWCAYDRGDLVTRRILGVFR